MSFMVALQDRQVDAIERSIGLYTRWQLEIEKGDSRGSPLRFRPITDGKYLQFEVISHVYRSQSCSQ